MATIEEVAKFLEENKDTLVELLVETEGKYDSQQIRINVMVKKLRQVKKA